MKISIVTVYAAVSWLMAIRNVWPVDIAVAPFALVAAESAVEVGTEETRFTEAFVRRAREQDSDGLLSFVSVPTEPGKRTVSTAAEADRVASLYGYEHVLYGRVAVGASYVESELALYSRESQQVQKRFFSKVARGELSDAESDLAAHLVRYAYDAFGISKHIREYRTDFGGIILLAGIGSWTALGTWQSAVSGIAESFIGVRVVPVAPFRRGADWMSYFRFGCELRYGFGMNAPSVVISRVNGFDLLLPVELCLEPDRHRLVSFGISPALCLLHVYQQTLYAQPTAGLSGAFGICGIAGYEYWFRGRSQFALGTRVAISAVLFHPTFLHLSLDVYGSIRIGVANGGNDAGKNP
ncbi:MAG TPA: hypothetical protein VMW87_13190 [Spirochaetia bacterium]|nr:hypothetical protein [Spirochaetia bacterium]